MIYKEFDFMETSPVMYKFSKQRETIYNILASTDTHPTANWVFERAREVMPHISLGTVYRNLIVLAEQGRISVMHIPNCPERYDANIGLHYHLVCERCGKVDDLSDNVYCQMNQELVQKVEKNSGFQINHTSLYLSGTCPNCR